MAKGEHLSEFENMVLLALIRRGEVGYGMQLRREIEQTSGRTTSIGTVYSTLERMQDKALVSSWHEAPDPVRGGRPRRFFRIERAGLEALQRTKAQLDSMWAGVRIDLEEAN